MSDIFRWHRDRLWCELRDAKAEMERLQAERAECRRLLREACDKPRNYPNYTSITLSPEWFAAAQDAVRGIKPANAVLNSQLAECRRLLQEACIGVDYAQFLRWQREAMQATDVTAVEICDSVEAVLEQDKAAQAAEGVEMCYECWQQRGGCQIDNARVRECAELIKDVSPCGTLHIMIDDWNLEDCHCEFVQSVINENRYGTSIERLEAEQQCLNSLRGLTLEERVSALALAEGFWSTEGGDS